MEHVTNSLVVPDFSSVSDTMGEGTYSMRIIDSKVGQWEGRDGRPATTYIAWTMETFNEAEAKNNGRRYTHRTPIEGKGAFRLQEFYKAATGTECKGAFNRESLHGKEIEVTIGLQKNSEYTEVKSVKAISH